MTDEGIIKILLADDQPIIRQRLKSLILTCIGSANISEAEDTPSTLAITREVKPHVIILDISMPGGGGFRAIKTIKQQQPTPVVIVLTNYPYPQYRQRCLENGADYFLDKSSDFERIPELLLKVRDEGSDPPPSDHTIRESPTGEIADEKGFRAKERDKKTKAQLNQELKELRQQVDELQAAGTKYVRTTEQAEREHYFLVALNHAAQNVQRAHTPGEVYHAVGDEIARLGHHAIIFTLTPEGAHLTVAYHTFNSKLLRKAEKLAHLSVEELRLPVEPGSLYNEVINNDETLFFAFVAERMAQFIPGRSLSLAKRVTSLLGIEEAFYAPLTTAGEPYGMLVITGIDLVQVDAPAVTAFANQTTIALENARLYQEARSWAAKLEQRIEERTAARGENEEKYITERKRVEQELITSEVRYRRLFETAQDGILMLNAETGIILDVNPFLIKMLGFSHEQFLGRKIWELGTFKDIAANQANFAKLQQQEYIRYDNLPLETSHGRQIQVEFISNVYQVDHQAVIQCNIRDITELKRAEEALHQRTVQLEATNKELEAFSYSVSHDLRAPLRGIDGWSLALLEENSDQLDEQGRQYLDRVRSEAQRMGRLIDDLLQLSRVTRAEMQTSAVDLSALAQAVVARLQATQPERQVKVIIQPGLTAQGDAALLAIVLTNLLDNTWKFTGRRRLASIEFGCLPHPSRPSPKGRGEGSEGTVYFVKDNGVGFDMAFSQKLFSVFHRMHKTSEFPGTGIGLATVQHIVHRHGGRVWAEACVNRGATFYFTLEEAV